jgi:Terminase large subunit, T4likevirus-type, N-terminal
MATVTARLDATTRLAMRLVAWDADPVLLATRAGLPPDPWQARVLRSHAPRILLNCSRQAGKSTVVSALAARQAICYPESLVLLLSRAQRQSGELFRKTMAVMKALDWPIRQTALTAMTCELANGSRIVALPGSEETIRSFSNVALLLIDEASRVPDDAYASMRPVLAVSGGKLIALSTPFGTRGWWYEAWEGRDTGEPGDVGEPGDHQGTDQGVSQGVSQGTGAMEELLPPSMPALAAWERYRVPATDCPRISAAFLAEERKRLGFWWYEQEYGCTFLDAKSAAFRAEDIEAAFTGDALLPEIGAYLAPGSYAPGVDADRLETDDDGDSGEEDEDDDGIWGY